MYEPAQQQSQAIIKEIEELKLAASANVIPEKLSERIARMIERLERMARFGSYSAEFEVVSKYIEQVTALPWNKFTQDTIELTAAKQVMDKNHHGMESIKQMILDYLAVMKLKAEQASSTQVASDSGFSPTSEATLKGSAANAPILCFVGLQGVGKTTMAKSIAQALGRSFTRIPMGALGNVSELRGTPRSKLDADPGFIVKALQKAGSMNPLILLDEIDKTSGQEGLRSDMMAVLLEILDPQQNSHFVDHYLDYPLDLSSVFFITTANTTGTISTALLDRLEVIRFTSYSDEEKITIGKNYLLPKVLESLGLTSQQVIFTEEVWPQIVRPIGFDAGIRQLERNVTKICRHAARQIVEQNVAQVTISPENIRQYLPVDVAILN